MKLYSIICVIVTCFSFTNGQVQAVNGKVKVTIGTTAGCSDTVRFIADIGPVYEKYKQFLDIEFIPWGRTERINDTLSCQFHAPDCWANRLHRCVLNMLNGNQDAQMEYMQCEFSPPYPSFLLQNVQCARSAGLSLVDVDYCVSTTGDDLEGPAEEASREPMEVINFVPFIVFNDVIDVQQHNQARLRLESVICFALADDANTGITHCKL